MKKEEQQGGLEATGTGLSQVEEQRGRNEDVRGLKGKETVVTEGETIFIILQRSGARLWEEGVEVERRRRLLERKEW